MLPRIVSENITFRARRIEFRLRCLLALGTAALVASGCSKNDQIAKEPGAVSDAQADTTPADLGCPKSLHGPPLVLLPALDGTKYCMDVRETTRGEYDAFVAAKNGDVNGQPPECAWNTQFSPPLWDPNDPKNDTPPSTPYCETAVWTQMISDQAVGCVDFCDALAYCQWAGKRLCGRVGGSKWGTVYDTNSASVADWGKLVSATFSSSTDSEFMDGCTQGGKTKYPYGDNFEPGVCIDGAWVDAGYSKAITDLSSRQCHGTVAPFDGIYDLVGSVAEWQNVCWMKQESCVQVGYSGSCGSDVGTGWMQTLGGGVGIRCCADAVAATP